MHEGRVVKRPISLGGFTAAGVLVVAIMGGAVGGAVVMSGQGAATTAPSSVTLHQVADEVTAEPTMAPVVDEDPAPAADVVQSAPAPVMAPSGGSGETASEAADRAAAEADRASSAADRAEDTTAPKPAPVQPAPAPVATEEDTVAKPTTPAPECEAGQTRGVPARPGEYSITYACQGGKWVESGRTLVPDRSKQAPAPSAPVTEVIVVPPAAG